MEIRLSHQTSPSLFPAQVTRGLECFHQCRHLDVLLTCTPGRAAVCFLFESPRKVLAVLNFSLSLMRVSSEHRSLIRQRSRSLKNRLQRHNLSSSVAPAQTRRSSSVNTARPPPRCCFPPPPVRRAFSPPWDHLQRGSLVSVFHFTSPRKTSLLLRENDSGLSRLWRRLQLGGTKGFLCGRTLSLHQSGSRPYLIEFAPIKWASEQKTCGLLSRTDRKQPWRQKKWSSHLRVWTCSVFSTKVDELWGGTLQNWKTALAFGRGFCALLQSYRHSRPTALLIGGRQRGMDTWQSTLLIAVLRDLLLLRRITRCAYMDRVQPASLGPGLGKTLLFQLLWRIFMVLTGSLMNSWGFLTWTHER